MLYPGARGGSSATSSSVAEQEINKVRTGSYSYENELVPTYKNRMVESGLKCTKDTPIQVVY